MQNVSAGVMVAFFGALLLSFDALLLRGINGDILTVAFWRGLLTGVAALIYLVVFWRKIHPSFGIIRTPTGFIVSAFYGVASILFVMGVSLTSVANLLIIIATAPLWAAIASRIWLKEYVAAGTWVAIAFVAVGVYLVVAPSLEQRNALGDLVALGASLSMAGAFTVSRIVKEPLGLAPSVGGALSAVVLFPFVPSFSFDSTSQIILMAIEGGLLLPIALGLIAVAPRYLPAPQVGLFLLLETVLGPLWIALFLGELPSKTVLLGGGIVIATLVIHTGYYVRSSSSSSSSKSA